MVLLNITLNYGHDPLVNQAFAMENGPVIFRFANTQFFAELWWVDLLFTSSVPGWWFGCHEFYFPIYWVANHPNWLICFRGVQTTNQVLIVLLMVLLSYTWLRFLVVSFPASTASVARFGKLLAEMVGQIEAGHRLDVNDGESLGILEKRQQNMGFERIRLICVWFFLAIWGYIYIYI